MEQQSEIISLQEDEMLEHMEDLINEGKVFQENDTIDFIKIYFFYCENKKMTNFKRNVFDITKNKISKKELLALVLKNNKNQNKKFDLTGIYKYEPNIEEGIIKKFCKSPHEFSFITKYSNIEDILFEPGIELFNDNNALILFFNKNQGSNKLINDDKSKNKTQKKVKFNLKDNSNDNKTMKNYIKTHVSFKS